MIHHGLTWVRPSSNGDKGCATPHARTLPFRIPASTRVFGTFRRGSTPRRAASLFLIAVARNDQQV